MSRFVFSGERLREVRFPLGGIGAGGVSMDGGARFVDWQIANRPNMESYGGFSHIAVRAEKNGKVIDARALNGPLAAPYMGKGLQPDGGYTRGPQRETMAGVPHFNDVTMTAHFPFAEYRFEGDFPGKAKLRAFSPFEPMNDFDSSLPSGLFEVQLKNDTADELEYAIAFTLYNPDARHSQNVVTEKDGRTALLCSSVGADDRTPAWGQTCVATDAKSVSSQAYWYRGIWFDGLNMFWKDFNAAGPMKPRNLEAGEKYQDHGTLCVHLHADPGETVSAKFALGWYFPTYEKYWADGENKPKWRNWYAMQFTGAEHVTDYLLDNWQRLEAASAAFADALYGSTLPEEVIDAAGSTLSVLKSPTCVRLTDGSFYAWEGSFPRDGSCQGSCQHVWNYQYALPYLFPALERSMRELDYSYNLQADGAMPFRLQLPLGTPAWNFRPCVDGQMGGVIKTYREWRLSGDNVWLECLWPMVKRSLEYTWSDKNADRWDPQMSGVITGRQHHTLDMELFGPNAWLTGMYLAALEAAARMADAMGDASFGSLCRSVKQKGMDWMDENLFNGKYYIHLIDLNDKGTLDAFSDGVGSLQGRGVDTYWNEETGQIKYQIGEGCSIDQLLGQWHADLCGLGDLFDPTKVSIALGEIYKNNYVERLGDIFNPCRIYGLQDESGTLICAYPEGAERPDISAPYAEETMHGFEYSVACHMILRGMEKEGLACVRGVRDRYDGARRNPFNEIECGGYYARSMAAWSLVNAYCGLSVDMVEGAVSFSPLREGEPFRSVWSGGGAWGDVMLDGNGRFQLRVLGGALVLNALHLPTLALPELGGADAAVVSYNGVSITEYAVDEERIGFVYPVALGEGDILEVRI